MGDAAAARAGADAIIGPVVVGAQAFYDGKASKISGLTVKGNKLIIKLTRPFPSLPSVHGDELVRRHRPVYPVQRAGLHGLVGHGRAVLHRRPTTSAARWCSARNKYYTGSARTTLTRSWSRSASTRTRASCRSRRARRTTRTTARRCPAASLGDQYGVNKTQFWVKPTSVTSWWALNTLPGHAVRERQPPQGGQLGDRSSGAGPRRRQVRWSPHRPAPAAGHAGLHPEQQPLRLRGRQRRQGEGCRGRRLQRPDDPDPRTGTRPRTSTVASSCSTSSRRSASRRRPRSVPSAQLFSRAGSPKAGNYDMSALGWQADYPDPENFINVLFDGAQIPTGDGSSNNWSFFNSPKYNTLMKKAALMTGDARYKAYGNLDIQMMKDAAPPLRTSTRTTASSSRRASRTSRTTMRTRTRRGMPS